MPSKNRISLDGLPLPDIRVDDTQSSDTFQFLGIVLSINFWTHSKVSGDSLSPGKLMFAISFFSAGPVSRSKRFLLNIRELSAVPSSKESSVEIDSLILTVSSLTSSCQNSEFPELSPSYAVGNMFGNQPKKQMERMAIVELKDQKL